MLPGERYIFRVTATDRAGNAATAERVVARVQITKYYYHGGQRVALRQGKALYFLHTDHLGSTSLTTDATGNVVARRRYAPYGKERWAAGTAPTDFGFTGQRDVPGTGLMYYHARYYHPALGRFVSADSIVPGAASGAGGGAVTLGYDPQTRLTPLTVNLGEFAQQINAENREILQFGWFFQWNARTRREHNVPSGPVNPQALNRYAYVLNNPLRYVDPTGHDAGGNQIIGYEQIFDSAGNPVVDADGNTVYHVWYYDLEFYVTGNNSELNRFILYADRHAQAQSAWYDALEDTFVGAAVGLAGVVAFLGGLGSQAPTAGLNIPGWMLTLAGGIAAAGGVWEAVGGARDLKSSYDDIGQYSENAWDMFRTLYFSSYVYQP